jgi:hypothetical protein
MNYTPDKWVVIRMETNEQAIYKVFATNYGAYTTGDSWRLNSGISKVEDLGGYYNFHGYSGSVYSCPKNNYGTSSYTGSILAECIDCMEPKATIQILPPDYDFTLLKDTHEKFNN